MKKIYSIFIIIIFVLITSGCTKQVTNKTTEKVYLNIGARHYDNIDELYKDSSIIIIGKAVQSEDSWKGTFKSIDVKEQVYTQIFVEILEVIKGKAKQLAGNTLLLNQPGGIYKNVEYIEKNNSYLKEGEKYILFLNDEGGGNYTLISPYEGMLKVVNDDALPRSENSIFISKLPLSQIKEMLKKIQTK